MSILNKFTNRGKVGLGKYFRMNSQNKLRTQNRAGTALMMTIIFLTVIVIVVTTVYERTSSNVRFTSRRINDQDAIRVAEAGIEKAVWCLNNPTNVTDCPNNPNFTGESSVVFGAGTYTTTITGSGNSRTIDAYGTVSGSGGTSTKHLQIVLATTTASVSFQYGMQAGVGGLLMKNNNKITGNVFSNGPVIGTKSLITGDVVLAVGQPAIDVQAEPSVTPTLSLTELGKTSTALWLAQSFVPTINDKVYGVDLKVAKAGSPSAATLHVYDDNSGQPGTSLYSQTITAPTDAAGWEDGWTNQLFTASAPQLSINTTYWLVIKINSTGNSSNYWKVVRDTNDTSYAGGTSNTSTNGTAWNAAGYDSAFRLYLGGVVGTLEVGCTGSLCSDGNAIGGNAYAEIIKDTDIKQHACYKTITGTVRAGNGAETCTGSSLGAVTCDGTNTVYGTGPYYCHPNNPTFLPAPFPLSSAQIGQKKAQAVAGGTLTGNQVLTDGQSLGPKKIAGDLTIDAAASNPAILTGTVWVEGNIYLNGTLKLSDGYGSNSGTILADNPGDPENSGRIIVGSSGQLLGNSTTSTYIMALSVSTSLSETAAAIDVSNNLTAGVVYAANGVVNIQNNANIKEVTGQKIIMQNNTTITYETGLASVVFTGGPGGSWIYQRGTYQVVD